MKELSYDTLVIGGGAAGMSAALEVSKAGFSVAIVEREEHLGGILVQCIHNGFGLQLFKEELTGPEFADELIEQLGETAADVYLGTTVARLSDEEEGKVAYCYGAKSGVTRIVARTVVLAMGCRERNRGSIRTPGTRPAGVFTAGLAQRLVNVEGYIPGKDVVIVGSGDIGLIMARRMTWVGSKVHAVVEIQPYPSGLTRNIVQCLNDFDIPLYLSHVVSRIDGRDRVSGVEITPVENGIPMPEKAFDIACDTLLLSVGLIPENELSQSAGVVLDPQSKGAQVDANMMTSVPGIFSCGNVLHVHDLADYVAEEAQRTGAYVVDYLNRRPPGRQIRVKAGANVRYIAPGKINAEKPDKLYFRSLIVKNNAKLSVKLDHRVIKEKKLAHVQPSEMVSFKLSAKDAEGMQTTPDSVMEIALQ
jgi:NADPH-dependent 2,4-dienoyl-CoA reductase/sulfur reductase-like enzyme